MICMKCKTRIEFNEYASLLFTLAYKKWFGKFITAIAVLNLINILAYSNKESNPTFSQMIVVILFLGVYPLLVFLKARKVYFSSGAVSETREYEISPEKLIIRGESFLSEVDLKRCYKIEEIKNWFLIYQVPQVASLVPKRCFDTFEIAQIRDMFHKLSKYTKVKLI